MRSSSDDRKLNRIAGGSAGSADLIWMLPRLSERNTLTFIVTPRSREIRRSRLMRSVRKGITEIVASGDSSPSRVRKYMRIGTVVIPMKLLRNRPYCNALQTRRQPVPASLKVTLRSVIEYFMRGE